MYVLCQLTAHSHCWANTLVLEKKKPPSPEELGNEFTGKQSKLVCLSSQTEKKQTNKKMFAQD